MSPQLTSCPTGKRNVDAARTRDPATSQPAQCPDGTPRGTAPAGGDGRGCSSHPARYRNRRTGHPGADRTAIAADRADTAGPARRYRQFPEDPYRWLEDPTDPEVIAYLEAENADTEVVMAPTSELQTRLYDEIIARVQQTDVSYPVKIGPYFYYTRYEEGASTRSSAASAAISTPPRRSSSTSTRSRPRLPSSATGNRVRIIAPSPT